MSDEIREFIVNTFSNKQVGEKAGGNFGHAGRPGKIGGSAPKTGAARAARPVTQKKKKTGKVVTAVAKGLLGATPEELKADKRRFILSAYGVRALQQLKGRAGERAGVVHSRRQGALAGAVVGAVLGGFSPASILTIPGGALLGSDVGAAINNSVHRIKNAISSRKAGKSKTKEESDDEIELTAEDVVGVVKLLEAFADSVEGEE